MVVSEEINNIMGGIENTGDVRLHNHRRKLKQRFDIVKKLGQGTYGKVQLGINKETGQEVAIKTIRKCKIETEADLIRIRREIQIMSSVRHPNIIHIYEVFENREKMVLVMEYAAGGELYDYLSEQKVLSEEEARRIFRQIAIAVYYCHKHNICHRDLKLENILLDEIGNAKIADFGLSNVFSYSAVLSTFCGSPLYASPEIVKGTPYVGPEVDCWSLGVLLYTLVYGAMPFDGSNFKRLVKQISQGDYFEPKSPSPASALIADMLNVDPARRANIQTICNHQWINETYSEICLHVAEDLASQTPVRLDLLLSLTAPNVVNSEKIVVGVDQVPTNEESVKLEKPVRSQSLGSIPPLAVATNVIPLSIPETKEPATTTGNKNLRPKKKECSHNKTRKKEQSNKASSESTNQETCDKKEQGKLKEDNKVTTTEITPLANSETQVIVKPNIQQKGSEDQISPTVPESPKLETESPRISGLKQKKIQHKSKATEKPDKLGTSNKKSHQSPISEKTRQSKTNIENANKELPKCTPQTSDETILSEKPIPPCPNTPLDESFLLASTVALNKLVELAFNDEPANDFRISSNATNDANEGENRTAPKLMSSNSAETNASKAATLPRRRTSRAEIQLATPQFSSDNYKTEVEHYVNKPVVNHKTEILIPVSAPLPPKSLTKVNNQSKEHIIPIKLEQEPVIKTTSSSTIWSPSKSSIPRTSSSSLSRQSTVESDRDSIISTGEPIRKSPREVIIPIAIEGGGYMTPRSDTLSKTNSTHDGEKEGFTLRSTKRRQLDRSTSSQLDAADSLSSDEDDNFQLLTAENLFSTLLSRVRSLTNRLNTDEMRRSTAFPSSLFAQHGSFFDNFPSRRLSETRSFSQAENAPWRRTVTHNLPKRANSIRNRYSYFNEESEPTIQPDSNFQSQISQIIARKSFDKNMATHKTPASSNNDIPPMVESTSTLTTAKSEARQKLNNILAKYRCSSTNSDPSKLTNSKSLPAKVHNLTKATQAAKRIELPIKDNPVLEENLKVKPPRKSRFLRPDFYDTPREESKYIIKNETVRGFRERSLSRQRDLSRNWSTESFSDNNTSVSDYKRSKTCSLSGQTNTHENTNIQPNNTNKVINSFHDYNNSREKNNWQFGKILPDEIRGETFQSDLTSSHRNSSKYKSLALQNELENEFRKTKNMSSKLSGLMVAFNDTENQYEKKLNQLYGAKSNTQITSNLIKPVVNCSDLKDEKMNVNGNMKTNSKKLSMKKNKPSSFTKLEQGQQGGPTEVNTNFENCKDFNYELPLQTSSISSTSSLLENDSTSAITPSTEEDNDIWSTMSDNIDSQSNDNVNDRIRRRSFYSRFNIYKNKSLGDSIH